MPTTHEEMTPSRVRPAGRRGVLRWLALPLVTFLLSTGLVFSTQTNAYALADYTTFVPKVVQTGLRTVPKGSLVRAFCVGGPLVCGALTAGTLGWYAYDTRDTWMPIVKGIFSGEWSTTEGTRGTGCGITADINALLRETATPHALTVVYSWSGNGCYAPGAILKWDQTICKTPAGSILPGTSGQMDAGATGKQYLDGPSGSSSRVIGVCGTGSTLIAARAQWSTSPYKYTQFTGVPPDALAQSYSIQCKKPDGTIVTISDVGTWTDGRIYVPSCEQAIPGSIPWEITIGQGVLGGQTHDIVKVTTQPDVYQKYPDCFDALNGLKCQIKVWINGEVCVRGDAACVNWQDYAIDHPNRVECRFGGYVVAMSNCDQLKHAYKPKVKTVTEVDPTTGEPQLDPDATPGTGTGTGVTPKPNPDTITDPDAGQFDTRGCIGDGVSINPLTWVYIPVKCSFIWAFKPQTAMSVRVDGIKTAFDGKVPFAWLGIGGNLGTSMGQDCPNWRIKVGTQTDANVVCSSSFTAAVRDARPWLATGLIMAAFYPFLRSALYAAMPILKPYPTSGKGD